MIAFVKGILAEKNLAPVPSAVIEAGGVGYELFVPLSTYDALPREGEPCKLLAHDWVREDARLLYGFATAGERDLFLMLQSVSGVGPKTALSALSGASPARLRAALAEGDAKALARFPGIGKRTAEEAKISIGCLVQRPEIGVEDVKGRCLLKGVPKG
ncbi:MAG: Holliday junction branch migration protein RuvA, partial [Kiritimatiellae bacterium]|nr:Holliday junction branch migration protein RuvA [Kiritimatiellia bacterium]